MSSNMVQFPTECRVVVYGINSSTDQSQFGKFFQQFGTVKAVLLEKNHGYGYVQFKSPVAVQKAVSAQSLKFDNFPLVVISSLMLEWQYYQKTIEDRIDIKRKRAIDHQPEFIKNNGRILANYYKRNNQQVIKNNKKEFKIDVKRNIAYQPKIKRNIFKVKVNCMKRTIAYQTRIIKNNWKIKANCFINDNQKIKKNKNDFNVDLQRKIANNRQRKNKKNNLQIKPNFYKKDNQKMIKKNKNLGKVEIKRKIAIKHQPKIKKNNWKTKANSYKKDNQKVIKKSKNEFNVDLKRQIEINRQKKNKKDNWKINAKNQKLIKKHNKEIQIPLLNSTDCEIIYYSRKHEECVRGVKTKLLAHGLTADSLFCPNNQIPLCKILDNMIKRGCLYAIQFPLTDENPTLVSVLILYGSPQEFRMIPRNNAIDFILNDFRKNRSTEIPKPISVFQDHPLVIQSMLSQLNGGRELDNTSMYNVLIKYLMDRRDLQENLEGSTTNWSDDVKIDPVIKTEPEDSTSLI